MVRIFDENCINIMQTEDGFVAVFKSENDNPYDLQCKRVCVLNDTARDIDKEQFTLLKFGFNFENLQEHIDNYLLTLCSLFNKNSFFTVSSEGVAKVLDYKGNLINQGDFCYKSCVPFDIAVGNGVVWATYPELNTVIRYNLSSLRQELRTGGTASKVLSSPDGLLLEGQQLFICNASKNQILQMDTVTFNVQELLSFDEPVYQYLRVDGFNIVRLKSGVYRV